jgi:hypothetical protein
MGAHAALGCKQRPLQFDGANEKHMVTLYVKRACKKVCKDHAAIVGGQQWGQGWLPPELKAWREMQSRAQTIQLFSPICVR